MFGQQQQKPLFQFNNPNTSNIFGTTPNNNIFGTPIQSQPTPFATGIFNQRNNQPNNTIGLFNTSTQAPSIFGGTPLQQQTPRFTFPNNNQQQQPSIFQQPVTQSQPVIQNANQMFEMFLQMQQQQLATLCQQIGAIIETLGRGMGRGISEGIAQGFGPAQLNQRGSLLTSNFPDGTPIPVPVPVGRGSSFAEDYLRQKRISDSDSRTSMARLEKPRAWCRDLQSTFPYTLTGTNCLPLHPYQDRHRYANRRFPLSRQESSIPLYPVESETQLGVYPDSWKSENGKWKEGFSGYGYKNSWSYSSRYPKINRYPSSHRIPLYSDGVADTGDNVSSTWQDREWKRLNFDLKRRTNHFQLRSNQISFFDPYDKKYPLKFGSACRNTGPPLKAYHDRADVDFSYGNSWRNNEIMNNPRQERVATFPNKERPHEKKTYVSEFKYSNESRRRPMDGTSRNSDSRESKKTVHFDEVVQLGRKAFDSDSDTSISTGVDSQSQGDDQDVQSDHVSVLLKCGVKLTRPHYYCCPPLDDLDRWFNSQSGDCYIQDFTVGHLLYGKVVFDGFTNITGLNLDEAVEFHEREVLLYPYAKQKPRYGEGLYRPCTVTLYKVSPDKFDEKKLKKICREFSGTFVSFDAKDERWTFRIHEDAPLEI